ncbi:MAG: sulfatase-like hydrolase/transferase [Acidobacteria bacterium]|nr:sulfatase-like hydrolase/transferase [Acidobacteriota bacterium]
MESCVRPLVPGPGRRVAAILVLLAAFAGLAGPRAQASPPPPRDRPNIILIVLDTVRADALGRRAGARASNTPFLDAWSKHGLAFTGALSPADSTPGSHFSMLTGYPAGVYTSEADRATASVVHQLNVAGYDTLGISANGSVDPALMHSIEPFQSFVTSPAFRPTALSAEGWDTLQRNDAVPQPVPHGIEPNLAKELASAETINERLTELLSVCRPPNGFRRPVFLFLNFVDAHDPYFPPRSAGPPDSDLASRWPLTGDLRRGRPEVRPQPAESGEVPSRENVPRWRRATDLAPRDLEFLRSLYDGEVRSLDTRLAATMKILAAAGLLERAIVVVTSDHGEAFGEQGYLAHALEQHGIHVPELYQVPLLLRGYGVTLAPTKGLRERFSTASLADSFRSWAGLTRGVGPELDPIAVLSSARRKRLDAPKAVVAAPESTAAKPRAPETAEERARDEELARRLRSLGYLK